MAGSSSAQRVAKLASRGRGKRIRFQGGTTFPLIIGLVALVGIALTVYAKASLPDDGGGQPKSGVYWHEVYGMNVCTDSAKKDGSASEWLAPLKGDLTDQTVDAVTGQQVYISKRYGDTGVNSSDDGLIHWKPSSALATGKRAQLGLFLDNYGVTLTDTKLVLPSGQGGDVYDTSKYTCDGKKTAITVRVWPHYDNAKQFTDCITNCRSLHLDNNGMVFVIAVVPADTKPNISMPPWTDSLVEKAAADSGDAIPTSGATTTTTTTPGTATPGTATVGSAASSGTVAGSTPATVAGATGASSVGTSATTTSVPSPTSVVGATTTTTG